MGSCLVHDSLVFFHLSIIDTQLALKGYQLQSGEAVSTNATEMSETSSMDQLEHRLEEEENSLREAISAFDSLEASRVELLELLAVLNTADELVSAAPRSVDSPASISPKRPGLSKHKKVHEELVSPLLLDEESALAEQFGGGSALSFIAGIVDSGNILRSLEGVLWRATRGNLFFRSQSAEHNSAQFVFVVLFQGETIESKIRKIVGALGGRLYACPDAPLERAVLVREVGSRLSEMGIVIAVRSIH